MKKTNNNTINDLEEFVYVHKKRLNVEQKNLLNLLKRSFADIKMIKNPTEKSADVGKEVFHFEISTNGLVGVFKIHLTDSESDFGNHKFEVTSLLEDFIENE